MRSRLKAPNSAFTLKKQGVLRSVEEIQKSPSSTPMGLRLFQAPVTACCPLSETETNGSCISRKPRSTSALKVRPQFFEVMTPASIQAFLKPLTSIRAPVGSRPPLPSAGQPASKLPGFWCMGQRGWVKPPLPVAALTLFFCVLKTGWAR